MADMAQIYCRWDTSKGSKYCCHRLPRNDLVIASYVQTDCGLCSTAVAAATKTLAAANPVCAYCADCCCSYRSKLRGTIISAAPQPLQILTIVATDECIAILVLQLPIHILLHTQSLWQRTDHEIAIVSSSIATC
eukprot:GHRR01034893.1.p1 GENE.GHRR01034893.1~~GHRR01034893.1.p1  ORF type:complete len:135 (-),score=15.37 GHRR01034893.1:158-562(-)